MTDPKKELPIYLGKLIGWFVFIKYIFDERERFNLWMQKPEGVNAIDEGRSFFNLFQRISSHALLIELCKFIDEDEEKSLMDFLNKCKENATPLEPMSLLTDGLPKKIIPAEKFGVIIDEMIAKLNECDNVIQNLKTHRDKALAHTDASFFNDPDKHYETYPLPVKDVGELLNTANTILRKMALYLSQGDIDFTLHTVRGVDRVLEFMRAYNKLVGENGNNNKYRFDNYYKKKES